MNFMNWGLGICIKECDWDLVWVMIEMRIMEMFLDDKNPKEIKRNFRPKKTPVQVELYRNF